MPGYTRIEDLPELGPDEANAFREDFKPRDVQKFIRNNRLIIPSGAGMNNIQEGYNSPHQQQYYPAHNSHQQQYHPAHNPPHQQQYHPAQPQQYHPPQPQQQYNNPHNSPQQQTHEGYNNNPQKTHEEYIDEEFIEPQIVKLRERHNLIDPMSISCIDIASHIQNCPICSKFYNGDKSLYIIIIIILAIVSLLLLKRVLGV